MARLLCFGIFLLSCIITIQANKPRSTQSLQELIDNEINKSMQKRFSGLGDKLSILDDIKQQFKFWNMYKNYYKKNYTSSEEERTRLQNFLKNLKFITKENDDSKHKKRYKLGLNELSSLSLEEIRQRYTGLRLPSQLEESKIPIFNGSSRASRRMLLPDALDYRSFMNPIENQGSCGSCYAFATLATIEAAYAIKKDIQINLSKQEIVDCSTGTGGCGGGWFAPTCDYVKELTGLYSAEDYPYLDGALTGGCRRNPSIVRFGDILSYGRVEPGDEEAMKIALNTFGPLFVVISVGEEFQNYQSGILDIPNCSKSIDHAVVIVGYGTEDGQDYWLIRNSWGEYNGDQGHYKMARNKDDMCGISQYVYYPIV